MSNAEPRDHLNVTRSRHFNTAAAGECSREGVLNMGSHGPDSAPETAPVFSTPFGLSFPIKVALAGVVAIAAIVAVAGGSPARADTIVPFTWNPSARIAGAGPAFTADTIVASDYVYAVQAASNNVPYASSFVFAITGFTLGGAPVSVPGLGTNYGLYFRIEETDQLINGLGTTIDGTVSLFADLTNNDGAPSVTLANHLAFANPAGVADDILLGSGPILSSAFRVPVGGPVSKSWLTGFDPAAGSSAFFLSPLGNHVELELLNTNTATSRQFIANPDGSFTTLVNGAVGTINVAVPEPSSFLVLTGALVGLGLIRRRRFLKSRFERSTAGE